MQQRRLPPRENKGVSAENFVFSTKSCFIAVADRDLASPTKPDFWAGAELFIFLYGNSRRDYADG